MTTPTLPIANPIVVMREEFDDWAVLFDPDTAKAVGVNPVGVAIWKLLDGRHTLGQIAAELRKQFSDTTEKVEDDVIAFIQQLADNGFIGREIS